MIRSYFIISLRYFLKNRLFTLINLVGLATGMTAFIIIIHYIHYEQSFDQFHQNKETLFRVTAAQLDEEGNTIGEYATTNAGIGPMMKDYFVEVVEYVRMIHTRPLMPKPVLSYQNNKFYEDHIYYADNSFFQLFSYSLVYGNLQTALSQPGNTVISESMAKKYFGEVNPLGKTINLETGARGNLDLKVTGVMSDFPPNSHFYAEMLISFNTFPTNWNLDEHLDWGDFYVYVSLRNNGDHLTVTPNLQKFLRSILGEYSDYYRISLQNIEDIHLNADLMFEAKPTGDGQLINLMLLIAVIILLVAWINYVNLTAAKSLEYAKEAGLRKMFGASKGQLCLQYIINALVINTAALLIAFSLTQLTQPFISRITSMPLNQDFMRDKLILLVIFSFILSGSILSGLYPAFILSGQNLNKLVKGSFLKGSTGKLTQKSLVVFQFVISVTLIALTLTVFKQMNYMQKKDLGMVIDRTVVVKGPTTKGSSYQSNWQTFVDKLSYNNQVKAVASSSEIPGNEMGWGRSLYAPSIPNYPEVPVNIVTTESGFFSLYEMNFLAGRNFSASFNDPDNAAILNEKAVQDLGFESPEDAIDRRVMWDENGQTYEFKIIGVIQNFHQQSPKKNFQAIIFPQKKYIDPPWAEEFYSVKLEGIEYQQALQNLEEVWHEVFGDHPFDYFFLDSFFERQYKADRRFGQIFSIFTLLAILIANLGLLGLFSYTVIQKTKEIGIRKALGASAMAIAKMLSYQYVRLILIALFIAVPIAYYAALEWLHHFAYRINLDWWFLIIPVLVTVITLMLTLSLHLIKSATTNPVEALRYE